MTDSFPHTPPHRSISPTPRGNSVDDVIAGLIPPHSRVLLVGRQSPDLVAALEGGGCGVECLPPGRGEVKGGGWDVIVHWGIPLEGEPDLNLVRSWLAEGGKLIAAVANASHGARRLGLLLDRLPAPDESRPGAVAYGWRGLTDLLEQRGWTVADAVATVADVLNGLPGPDQEGESLGEAALPFEVVEWVRDQPRARDREFVVVCVPSDPNGGVAPTPIPRPAVDLPRPDDIFARERRQRDAEVKALTDMVQRILETVDHQALLTLDASVGDKAAAATARLAAERARADAVAAAATNTQQLLELRASFGEALKAAKVAMRKEANHRVAAERHRVALQYRSSMSYRLGRAITAPGRLAGRVLRRLLRRRPKGR